MLFTSENWITFKGNTACFSGFDTVQNMTLFKVAIFKLMEKAQFLL
jgi:hypothetical protein